MLQKINRVPSALKDMAARLKGLWDRSGKKHRCRNCHFLSKSSLSLPTESWDKKDRDEYWARYNGEDDLEELARRGYSYKLEGVGCYKAIWWMEYNEHDISLKESLMQEIMSNRAEQCFFVQYHAPMKYSAAEELFRIRYDTRQLKRSLRWTIIGLLIAAISSFISIGLQIYNAVRPINPP